MEENTIVTTKTYEEMIADLISRFTWVFFTCASVGVVILLEILFFNAGCKF